MEQTNKKSILIVDDDTGHRLMLKATLDRNDYIIFEADCGEEAVKMVTDQFYDLILLDLKMKTMDGIETLKIIKRLRPSIPVLMMTAYASVETAVLGLKLGAFDYIVKPLDMELVLQSIEKVLNINQLKIESKVLKKAFHVNFDFSTIVGVSKKIIDVFEILAMAAPSDATILILGESGTGKELIANVVYKNSFRKNKPFVKINCAALSENLLESELFGHEKGAFTGAAAMRMGRFEQANGGTLFLDEIGDMSLETQAKILRVLQEGEFERLGGEKTIRADVRIIAATNKDLDEEVKTGGFRKDLYFRLSVVTVLIPPLRERMEDIPSLSGFFLQKYAKKNNRLINGFTPAAIDLLMRYDWPGNVRELENIVERAVILSRETFITPAALPANIKGTVNEKKLGSGNVLTGRSIKDMEKELILETLKQTENNITKSAAILGLTRRGLQYKLKEMGIR